MNLLRWLMDFLAGVFIFISFSFGVLTQIYGNFYIGIIIVVFALGVGFVREVGGREKRRNAQLGDVAAVGLGAFISVAGMMVALLLAVVFRGRTLHIILLNSALSSMFFLSASFLKFWRRR